MRNYTRASRPPRPNQIDFWRAVRDPHAFLRSSGVRLDFPVARGAWNSQQPFWSRGVAPRYPAQLSPHPRREFRTVDYQLRKLVRRRSSSHEHGPRGERVNGLVHRSALYKRGFDAVRRFSDSLGSVRRSRARLARKAPLDQTGTDPIRTRVEEFAARRATSRRALKANERHALICEVKRAELFAVRRSLMRIAGHPGMSRRSVYSYAK
jgi:hypothetical protein